jgi:hypothetical protein
VKALLRGSRAIRAQRNAEALLHVGIDAPRNVLFGKLSGGREYLYTEEAPGQGINYWLQVALRDNNSEQRLLRRQLLRELGIFIGRVHATGFIHGDLRPGNVLAALQHGRFRFTLIDNERNVRKNPPPGRMLLHNLMQLNMLRTADLSRADRMRFFSSWRRQMRDLSPIEAKIIGAQAFQWAMRRLHGKGQR